MPYALIPKDYTLEKVTRAQESAVRSKRRHDDIIAILSNENAALGITALASIVASEENENDVLILEKTVQFP